MTVADYILASGGVLLSLGASALTWLISMVYYFSPSPGPTEAAARRKGCVGLVSALALLVYFIGVIVSGSWGWQ